MRFAENQRYNLHGFGIRNTENQLQALWHSSTPCEGAPVFAFVDSGARPQRRKRHRGHFGKIWSTNVNALFLIAF